MRLVKSLYLKKLILNIIIFLVLSTVITYLTEKLPDRIYNYNMWVFKEREWEKKGSFYKRILKVRIWKAFLPELSEYVKGVFPKKHIKQRNREYLSKYIMESCKSEFTHWSIIASSLLFQLWSDWWVSFGVFITAIVLNLPYIIIQRYNRPRVVQVMERQI